MDLDRSFLIDTEVDQWYVDEPERSQLRLVQFNQTWKDAAYDGKRPGFRLEIACCLSG